MDPSAPQPAGSPFLIPSDRDRRAEPRLSAEILGLDVDASLSQGVYVRVLNVSTGGALVELHEWLRPGTRSTLRLSRPSDEGADRLVVSGQIVRCWVDRLAPLRYRAAIVFGAAPTQRPPQPGATDLTALLERPA
ncbi:MAG: PilZ domain-containing protein [Vicinamibacterales bacterium]